MRGLTGKNVLITGAASGIGRATALRFAEEGANVGIIDLDPDGAGETVSQIQAAGGYFELSSSTVRRSCSGISTRSL